MPLKELLLLMGPKGARGAKPPGIKRVDHSRAGSRLSPLAGPALRRRHTSGGAAAAEGRRQATRGEAG